MRQHLVPAMRDIAVNRLAGIDRVEGRVNSTVSDGCELGYTLSSTAPAPSSLKIGDYSVTYSPAKK